LDAEVEGRADLVGEAIEAELELTGHGADLLPQSAARADEQRQDEVGRGQGGLADQLADERTVTQATGAGDREAGRRGSFAGHGVGLGGRSGDVEAAGAAVGVDCEKDVQQLLGEPVGVTGLADEGERVGNRDDRERVLISLIATPSGFSLAPSYPRTDAPAKS